METDGLKDVLTVIDTRIDMDGELVVASVKVEPLDASVETVAKVDWVATTL